MHKVVDTNNAFKLNEYQGTYEVVSGNVGDNGKFWMDWTIASEYDSEAGHSVPVKRDDGRYRNIPIKIILGDRKQAMENLRWLLGELEGHEVGPPVLPAGTGGSVPIDGNMPSDDVPF